jgi:hypothetical protein
LRSSDLELRFRCSSRAALTGIDYLFGPRDIPHRYTAGDSGCRMLFIMVPGGMEDVVRLRITRA